MIDIIDKVLNENNIGYVRSLLKDDDFDRTDVVMLQRGFNGMVDDLRSDNPKTREVWITVIEAVLETILTACVEELHERGL